MGKYPPMQKGVMKPIEAAHPARLSAPFTLAGMRLDGALMAAKGLSSTRQRSQPCVVAGSWLITVGISLSQHKFTSEWG